MRPEDKDKILLLAKEFLSGEDLERFAERLDRMEEERHLAPEELAEKVGDLLSMLIADRMVRAGIKDDELLSLTKTLTKELTYLSIRAFVVPKIRELLAYSSIRRVQYGNP